MPSGPGYVRSPQGAVEYRAEVASLRNALDKMGAGPNGTRKVMWTSLREEPVLVSCVACLIDGWIVDFGVVCQVAASRSAPHRQASEQRRVGCHCH
jgi:hypothetical protein